MSERVEFYLNRRLLLVLGIVLIALAGLFAVWLFPTGLPELDGNTAGLLAFIAAMAGFGLWVLSDLRKTGVIVVVDKHGITDGRLMPTPILWHEVERCALVSGYRGDHLQLVLHPGSRAATQLSRRKVTINERVLWGEVDGVRGAIARLAPQVPRDW
ncbi:hypothetical protein [Phreatobacter sp.]|uniref:hypothetical protein n=1 Tax=Phreatobacter sp. TaxID=1966341 RepID=UPI003F6F66A2